MVCPVANLFQKALAGPEGRKDNSDGISLDNSLALLSKIQADKSWRSFLPFFSDVTLPLLLDMCMHSLSWAFAILKVVISRL